MSDFQRWICDACGFIYDEAKGDPDSGLAPGTRYADIPDDWQCPLCGLSKGDLRLLPDTPVKPAPPAPARQRPSAESRGSAEHLVIVGAGVAGWSVAEAVRRRDPERPILLVSACQGLVYPKPALSLALAQGKSAVDLVEADAATRAAELGIEIRTEVRVLKIDPQRKRLTTVKGAIEYGSLVLALGARQRELPIAGDAAGAVMRVNDLASYKALRERLSRGVRHVTILGAGLIGCEFADDMTTAGYQVCIIDPQAQPLFGLLPPVMARELRQRLAGKGVEWCFGTTLSRLDHAAAGLRAVLEDGAELQTDLVLSAAGLVPNTQLAAKSGLAIGKGILVDNDMCCSVADVYALGDCAEVSGQVFAFIEPIRRQAEAIAAHLAGTHERFMPLPPLVRLKTPSYPLTVCRPAANLSDAEWTPIADAPDGSYFEIRREDHIAGFAVSGRLATEAGSLYRRVRL